MWHERAAGCNAFTKCTFPLINITSYPLYTTTEITDAATGKKHAFASLTPDTNPANLAVYNDFARAIAGICVPNFAKREWSIYINTARKWNDYSRKTDAANVIHRELKNHPDGQPAMDFIEWMMNDASMWDVSGGDGFWPMGDHVFMKNGVIMKNTYRNDGINIPINEPFTDDEKTMLSDVINDIIRINLCNKRGNKNFDELWDIIHDTANDDEYEFRYVIHNIAMNYMRPGFNIRTNLALCGQPGGMGKNYLENLMVRMIGQSLCTSPSNPTGPYNEWADNHTFIVLNELQNQSNNDEFNQKIKTTTIENTIAITQKYRDQRMVSNMANYWLFSNSLTPYKTDSTDRRTIFIRTFNDESTSITDGRKRAADDITSKYDDDDVAHALAKLCHYMEIDTDVLKYRQTELAKKVIANSFSLIEQFLKSENLADYISTDASKKSDKNQYIKINDLFNGYNAWAKSLGYEQITKPHFKSEFSAHPDWFKFSNKKWWVLDGFIDARDGCPVDVDPDEHDDDERDDAPIPPAPVYNATVDDLIDAANPRTEPTATPPQHDISGHVPFLTGHELVHDVARNHTYATAKNTGASHRMARVIARENGGV